MTQTTPYWSSQTRRVDNAVYDINRSLNAAFGEAIRLDNPKRKRAVMTFGRFEDQPIDIVPRWYLGWLVNEKPQTVDFQAAQADAVDVLNLKGNARKRKTPTKKVRKKTQRVKSQMARDRRFHETMCDGDGHVDAKPAQKERVHRGVVLKRKNGKVLMPFGKYRGRAIESLSSEYLTTQLENATGDHKALKPIFEAVLKRRGLTTGKPQVLDRCLRCGKRNPNRICAKCVEHDRKVSNLSEPRLS